MDLGQITEAGAAARVATEPHRCRLSPQALDSLKFSDALHLDLAIDTLAKARGRRKRALTTPAMGAGHRG